VVGLIAGGYGTLLKTVEDAEEDASLCVSDLQPLNLTANDMGWSGSTPYLIGALLYARQLGCPTAAISCNPDSPLVHEAQVAISTGAMVKLGKVYQNLMVDVKATKPKLVDRACHVAVEATGAQRSQAEAALAQGQTGDPDDLGRAQRRGSGTAIATARRLFARCALISYWKVATVITFGISGLPLTLTIDSGKVMLYLASMVITVIVRFIFTWIVGFNVPEK